MADVIDLWGRSKKKVNPDSATEIIEREKESYKRTKAKQRATGNDFKVIPGLPTLTVQHGLSKLIDNMPTELLSNPEIYEGLRLYARLGAQFEDAINE